MPVGLERCLEHYLRLHHHTAMKRAPFVLGAYNVAAKRAASKSAFVSCRFGSRGEDFAALDGETVRQVAEYMEACHAAAQRNAPRPPPPAHLDMGGVNAAFLRSVQYSARQMQHSHGRTLEARKEAH